MAIYTTAMTGTTADTRWLIRCTPPKITRAVSRASTPPTTRGQKVSL